MSKDKKLTELFDEFHTSCCNGDYCGLSKEEIQLDKDSFVAALKEIIMGAIPDESEVEADYLVKVGWNDCRATIIERIEGLFGE